MKIVIRALMFASLFLITALAVAQPRQAAYTTFYDESQEEVGWFYFGCHGSSYGGTTNTGIYVTEFQEICGEEEPLTCDDVGMMQWPNMPGWCVSEFYCIYFGNCGGRARSRIDQRRMNLNRALLRKSWEILPKLHPRLQRL